MELSGIREAAWRRWHLNSSLRMSFKVERERDLRLRGQREHLLSCLLAQTRVCLGLFLILSRPF